MTSPDERPADDEEEFSPEVPPLGAEDLDLDVEFEEEEEADEDADEDSDEDSQGATDGTGDDEAAAAEAERKRKKSSKARGNLEAEPEPGDPATKVPTRKKMLSALQWAFEGEEGVPPELLERYADHAIEVLEQNKVMNLTAIQDPKEIAAKHYLDCWRTTRLVPLIAKKVMDLGTGGGFPGLPVALAEPNCSMTVVDSTRKKAEWVQGTIEKLGVRNARSIWTRAEDHLTTERVDIVLVRAVSSVRENIRVLRKVRHSLQDMVMLKGNSWSREVRAAEREAERLGFKLDTVWEHELPDEMGQRAILVYRAPGGVGF